MYHGRLTKSAVIGVQPPNTCVPPLRDDTLIDMKNPIHPLEYDCRRVQHCGKVNKASLPSLLNRWQIVQTVQRRPSL